MIPIRLILARHGNTFDPHDTPVWVGAQSDLPLVDKGIQQARAIGMALLKGHITPSAIFASTLKRTYETAFIVCEMLKIHTNQIHVDSRLTEIDYGKWEGQTNEAIIASGMGYDLRAWAEESIFPKHAGWIPSYSQLIDNIHEFLAVLPQGTSLGVTSNGILRFFAMVCQNAKEYAHTKVATGHMCIVTGFDRSWNIEQWNKAPTDLRL